MPKRRELTPDEKRMLDAHFEDVMRARRDAAKSPRSTNPEDCICAEHDGKGYSVCG